MGGVETISRTSNSVIGTTTHSGIFAAAKTLIVGAKHNKMSHFVMSLILIFLFVAMMIGIGIGTIVKVKKQELDQMDVKIKKYLMMTLLFYICNQIILLIYYGSDADKKSESIDRILLFFKAIPLLFHFWAFSIAAFCWIHLFVKSQVSNAQNDIFRYQKR